jgi:RimJ/RimL family protein N-acetyltransferase
VELRPEYPIATSRLLLRPLTAADADALLAYRSLPDPCRFVPFTPMDRDAVRAKLGGVWATTEIVAEGRSVTLGIELARTGDVIGDVMLSFTSATHRGGEVGWMINPDHAGHGYATEAAHAILHLAFDQLGLHRVVARIDARNEPSLRLADRLGMRRETLLIRNAWFKGEWSDEVDCALLEDEWLAQHEAGIRSCRWPLAAPVPSRP